MSSTVSTPMSDLLGDSSKDWVDVCPVERVAYDRGIAALVDGIAVAVFRLAGSRGGADLWFAVDHIEPVTAAPVMARGLVGSAGTVPTVASPLYKERYSLETGECLDNPALRLRTWLIGTAAAMVRIRHHPQ